jgi:large subunit ribosomal protein L13
MITKTYMAKTGQVEQAWHLVDATDQVVGRLATQLARLLQGKHKPEYTPHVDCGDFIVVINAEKVRLTGASKPTQRVFKRYSGYPGGLKETPVAEVIKRHPERILSEAVRRMMPKSRLGDAMFKKLKLFVGPDHTHQAQQPEPLELNS